MEDNGDFDQIKQASFSDRLKMCYFRFFATTVFTVFFLSVSLMLLGMSLIWPRIVHSRWFHAAEGLVTIAFVAEVALRLLTMQATFWKSPVNVGEAALCIFCVVVFGALSVAETASAEEHDALLIFRYAAQLMRVAVVWRQQRAQSKKASDSATLRMSIYHGDDEDEDVEGRSSPMRRCGSSGFMGGRKGSSGGARGWQTRADHIV